MNVVQKWSKSSRRWSKEVENGQKVDGKVFILVEKGSDSSKVFENWLILVKNGLKKSTLVEKVKEWSEKVLTS
jgi:hypothetical protein